MADIAAPLGETVRMVVLQFSFSNVDALPLPVRDAKAETIDGSKARKNRHTGTLLVAPVGKVNPAGLARELEASGYELVDAFKQCRYDSGKGQSYWMVRFVFVHSRFVDPGQPHRFADTSAIKVELQKLLEQAFWRVRIFLNPFYQNGEEVSGYQALSINLEARIPLLDGRGKSILARKRNAQGRKVGKPVPLEPDFVLRCTVAK